MTTHKFVVQTFEDGVLSGTTTVGVPGHGVEGTDDSAPKIVCFTATTQDPVTGVITPGVPIVRSLSNIKEFQTAENGVGQSGEYVLQAIVDILCHTGPNG